MAQKIKRSLALFRQFQFLTALRFLLAEALRLLFDRYNLPAYAQTGEDRVFINLIAYLGFSIESKNGFYVDVGSNHPIRFSNTFDLYKRGWSGLCIDANPELIRLHQVLRKKDQAVCAVISDQKRTVDFTEFDNPLVSSLDKDHISLWEKWDHVKRIRKVETRTLESLFVACNVPRVFDLLSIDVEGHDYEVLSSFDLKIYRPRFVIVEMHDFELNNPMQSKTYSYLIKNSYKLVSFAVMNGYFVDNLPKVAEENSP